MYQLLYSIVVAVLLAILSGCGLLLLYTSFLLLRMYWWMRENWFDTLFLIGCVVAAVLIICVAAALWLYVLGIPPLSK